MHKRIALGLFLAVVSYTSQRYGFDESLAKNIILGMFLVPILFYRTIAYFSGFGFPEYFARDFKTENHPEPYALFFWILYLIVCAFIVFNWSIF